LSSVLRSSSVILASFLQKYATTATNSTQRLLVAGVFGEPEQEPEAPSELLRLVITIFGDDPPHKDCEIGADPMDRHLVDVAFRQVLSNNLHVGAIVVLTITPIRLET